MKHDDDGTPLADHVIDVAPAEKTFTQSDLDRIVTARVAKQTRAHGRELAELEAVHKRVLAKLREQHTTELAAAITEAAQIAREILAPQTTTEVSA